MRAEMESPNLCSPVHHLDGDSLAEIFFWVVRDEGSKLLVKYKNLMRITHVCRAWRAIALNLAELWGDVAFASGNPHVFETLLQRAGTAPIDLPFTIPASEAQLEYIARHSERFRSMHISRSVRWDPTSLAGKHMPYLESARLYAGPRYEGVRSELDPVVMPRLRDLYMSLFCVPFAAPNLRKLRITAATPFAPRTLVQMLNALPNLEHLRLRFCLPTSYVQDGEGVALINLPNITCIDLKDLCTPMSAFLEQLRIKDPACAVLLTLSRNFERPPSEVQRLARALQPYLSASFRDSILMSSLRESSISVYSSNSHGFGEYMVRDGAVVINSETAENPASLHTVLFEQFHTSQIRHLCAYHADFAAGATPDDWADLYRHPLLSDHLQTLKTYVGLTHPDASLDRATMLPLLLGEPIRRPELREMTLSGDACSYVLTVADGASNLSRWLKERIVSGHPLERLRLEGEIAYEDRSAMESLAEQEVWERIRDAVDVIDEWTVRTKGLSMDDYEQL
ncbi:unnamed protein product [Peniophora sp. CBMAI 1063]|nr:unnamed protein product [Peniophora sp. CBMAI 1063]